MMSNKAKLSIEKTLIGRHSLLAHVSYDIFLHKRHEYIKFNRQARAARETETNLEFETKLRRDLTLKFRDETETRRLQVSSRVESLEKNKSILLTI